METIFVLARYLLHYKQQPSRWAGVVTYKTEPICFIWKPIDGGVRSLYLGNLKPKSRIPLTVRVLFL